VTIGQFSAHSGGLRSLVRSTGVAAQEIEEQLTHRQRNDVIRALAFAYLTRLNGIVRILQGRQSAHAESDPIPPVLPLELCSTSACDFIALVGTYKKRIDHHFKERSEEVIQNIYEWLWIRNSMMLCSPYPTRSWKSSGRPEALVLWTLRPLHLALSL
jgi:hypothetical protein